MRQLVVFDFDWTLVDQDTDFWVLETLDISLRRKMEDLMPTEEWTDNISARMKELHAKGFTREDVENTLKDLPFHPAMQRTIRHLKSISSTILCLSSANNVFIDTILEDKKLADHFAEVITNPARWDESGLLLIRRRIERGDPQHNCPNSCYQNMCKGQELESFIARQGGAFDRIVYLGDGLNDYCPLLSLRSSDYALVRKRRGLEPKVRATEGDLKCQVRYWDGAWEVEEFFKQL